MMKVAVVRAMALVTEPVTATDIDMRSRQDEKIRVQVAEMLAQLQVQAETVPKVVEEVAIQASKSRAYAGRRSREHLTPDEIRRVIRAVGTGSRNKHRDQTMVLMGYRHGLRVGELVSLEWSQVHIDDAQIYITRSKGGVSGTHPLQPDELRALRRLAKAGGRWVFQTRTGGPLTSSRFRKLLGSRTEGLIKGLPIHPHMLRHSCGYALAAQGVDTRAIQAYLGHKSILHTARYTAIAPGRFDEFKWEGV